MKDREQSPDISNSGHQPDAAETSSQVDGIIAEYAQNYRNLGSDTQAVLEYKNFLRSIIESGNLGIEGIDPAWPESRKIRKIMGKWRDIRINLEDAASNISQARDPLVRLVATKEMTTLQNWASQPII